MYERSYRIAYNKQLFGCRHPNRRSNYYLKKKKKKKMRENKTNACRKIIADDKNDVKLSKTMQCVCVLNVENYDCRVE